MIGQDPLTCRRRVGPPHGSPTASGTGPDRSWTIRPPGPEPEPRWRLGTPDGGSRRVPARHGTAEEARNVVAALLQPLSARDRVIAFLHYIETGADPDEGVPDSVHVQVFRTLRRVALNQVAVAEVDRSSVAIADPDPDRAAPVALG